MRFTKDDILQLRTFVTTLKEKDDFLSNIDRYLQDNENLILLSITLDLFFLIHEAKISQSQKQKYIRTIVDITLDCLDLVEAAFNRSEGFLVPDIGVFARFLDFLSPYETVVDLPYLQIRELYGDDDYLMELYEKYVVLFNQWNPYDLDAKAHFVDLLLNQGKRIEAAKEVNDLITLSLNVKKEYSFLTTAHIISSTLKILRAIVNQEDNLNNGLETLAYRVSLIFHDLTHYLECDVLDAIFICDLAVKGFFDKYQSEDYVVDLVENFDKFFDFDFYNNYFFAILYASFDSVLDYEKAYTYYELALNSSDVDEANENDITFLKDFFSKINLGDA